jgi:hypothetical protein
MEQEGEASSSRIQLPYQDVRKFQHDGSNVGKIPKMLWKMLQELGYEKQPKYYGTHVTYEGSELGYENQPSPQDATSTLLFMMPPVKLTWSLIRVIANSWME